ncbi:MAG TPA: glycosyltransferase [Chthoniobacteraceae bacterium]|nr:glycosyltransferase [Chthoniobacteraceae bacterium]
MTKPEISIITPSYRQLRWLRLCAASVADQAEVGAEHIIQDACSGGELSAWAAEWTASHPQARVFEEKDKGMYDAINRGFRRAEGEVLAWLNCDEQYLPGTLAKVRDFFRARPEVDVAFGDALLVSESGELLSYRRTVLPSLLHLRLSHLNTLSCATFVRRSVIERGFFLEDRWKTIADGVWVAAMLTAHLPMAVIPEPLSAFTILEENLGQTEIARDERRRYLQETAASLAWMRGPVVAWHRVRKLLAGAYQKRRVVAELYTQDSPEKRKRIEADGLSFAWARAGK